MPFLKTWKLDKSESFPCEEETFISRMLIKNSIAQSTFFHILPSIVRHKHWEDRKILTKGGVFSRKIYKTNAGEKRLPAEKHLPHLKRRLQRQSNNVQKVTQPGRIALDWGLGFRVKQATLHATQTFFSEQKLFKQHGTIKTYLDTQRQQHQFYNLLEYFSDRPGLQQQKKAVPLVPLKNT